MSNQSKSKKRTAIIAAVVFVLAAAAVLTVWLLNRPDAPVGAKSITVIVNHLDGGQKTFDLHTDSEFLRGALEEAELVEGTESQYGLFVTGVDGEIADDAKQQWWGYSINGEMAMFGIDEQPIADGDKVEFTLNEGY